MTPHDPAALSDATAQDAAQTVRRDALVITDFHLHVVCPCGGHLFVNDKDGVHRICPYCARRIAVQVNAFVQVPLQDICPRCHGKGSYVSGSYPAPGRSTCNQCGGTGRVPLPEESDGGLMSDNIDAKSVYLQRGDAEGANSMPTKGERTPAAYEATRNRDNRERIRLALIDLTRLADACGWGYELESGSAGHAKTYALTVWEPQPGGDEHD